MSNSPDFVWLDLHLPIPTPPDAATEAVRALAGLSRHPRVVLEARGHAGRVAWRLGAQGSDITRVLAAIRAHIPGLLTTTAAPPDSTTAEVGRAAGVRVRGHRSGPLDTASIEPVTRSLLAALGQAGSAESVRLQVVLGPRGGPRFVAPTWPTAASTTSAAADRQTTRRAQAKYDHYRFGCTVRIGAQTTTPDTDPARIRRLIEGVAAALRGLEAPGLRIGLRRDSLDTLHRAASPWWWPLELTTSEIACLLAWPLAKDATAVLPGVGPRHPRLLPVRSQIAKTGRVLGDGLSPIRPVAQRTTDALRHTHLIGPTGTGKSTLLANLALGDIETGHGVVVIDPKADLITDLLARIPAHRAKDVVILDPLDPAPIGLQPLGGRTPAEADLSAETMFGIIKGLYPDAFGPMTADVLHAALLSLARHGDGCLAMVPMLLANTSFRRKIVGPLSAADPIGLGGFWATFEALSEPQQQQTIAPLLRRLRPILLRPGLRAVFGQRRPRFSLDDVFTTNRILLVPLSKGTLGPEAAALLGSVLVGLLWQTALGRSAVPANQRRPVHVIVDEFADVLRLGTDLGDALAQARGLGVGFTIAQQHLSQAPKALKDTVLANTLTRICFALSDHDARDIAATTAQLDAEDLRALPAYHAYARILTGGTAAPWCSLATRPLPDQTRTDRDVHALRAGSRDTYGQPIAAVDADLLALTTPPTRGSSARPIGRARPTTTTGSGSATTVQSSDPNDPSGGTS